MKKKSLIPSPCISVCTVDEESGYCMGCNRTFDEIAQWDSYSDERKQTVIDELNARDNTLPKPNQQ